MVPVVITYKMILLTLLMFSIVYIGRDLMNKNKDRNNEDDNL